MTTEIANEDSNELTRLQTLTARLADERDEARGGLNEALAEIASRDDKIESLLRTIEERDDRLAILKEDLKLAEKERLEYLMENASLRAELEAEAPEETQTDATDRRLAVAQDLSARVAYLERERDKLQGKLEEEREQALQLGNLFEDKNTRIAQLQAELHVSQLRLGQFVAGAVKIVPATQA